MKKGRKFFPVLLLILVVFASMFAVAHPTLLFAQGGGPEPEPPIEPTPIPSPFPEGSGINNLTDFINFILNEIVLPVGSVIAVFFMVYAGFLFVTAGGNEEKINLAKRTFLWTVVGVAILLGAVVISNGIKNTICDLGNVPGLGCPGQN